MRKETAQEMSRLSNKITELESKLKGCTHSLNFYKEQNASMQQIIAHLEAKIEKNEAREKVWGQFVPYIEAPDTTEIPPLTKEDY